MSNNSIILGEGKAFIKRENRLIMINKFNCFFNLFFWVKISLEVLSNENRGGLKLVSIDPF